ncbi:hypothetical protein Tco_0614871 [Tanacetum coccineum]
MGYSREVQHDGRVRCVKSSTLIGSLKLRGYVAGRKAQGDVDFTLKALTQQKQGVVLNCPVAFDSTKSSILPPLLLDSDSPFTTELSASITLNSLRNEDKVFKPGILVYHAIHDKNLVTLEENLKENISSGTLLVFKEPSFLLPPPEPPDECLNFEPILVIKNVVLHEDLYQRKKTLPLNVEDVNSFTFIIWTFLPYFTYIEESPLIFSFRSQNFVFDPGIVTFHKPVSCSMKVFHLLSLRTN